MPETNSLSHYFKQLEDPRIARSKRHSLHDILIVSICALLGAAEGFVDMEEFWQSATGVAGPIPQTAQRHPQCLIAGQSRATHRLSA